MSKALCLRGCGRKRECCAREWRCPKGSMRPNRSLRVVGPVRLAVACASSPSHNTTHEPGLVLTRSPFHCLHLTLTGKGSTRPRTRNGGPIAHILVGLSIASHDSTARSWQAKPRPHLQGQVIATSRERCARHCGPEGVVEEQAAAAAAARTSQATEQKKGKAALQAPA